MCIDSATISLQRRRGPLSINAFKLFCAQLLVRSGPSARCAEVRSMSAQVRELLGARLRVETRHARSFEGDFACLDHDGNVMCVTVSRHRR